jgi:hypothetical protein
MRQAPATLGKAGMFAMYGSVAKQKAACKYAHRRIRGESPYGHDIVLSLSAAKRGSGRMRFVLSSQDTPYRVSMKGASRGGVGVWVAESRSIHVQEMQEYVTESGLYDQLTPIEHACVFGELHDPDPTEYRCWQRANVAEAQALRALHPNAEASAVYDAAAEECAMKEHGFLSMCVEAKVITTQRDMKNVLTMAKVRRVSAPCEFDVVDPNGPRIGFVGEQGRDQ